MSENRQPPARLAGPDRAHQRRSGRCQRSRASQIRAMASRTHERRSLSRRIQTPTMGRPTESEYRIECVLELVAASGSDGRDIRPQGPIEYLVRVQIGRSGVGAYKRAYLDWDQQLHGDLAALATRPGDARVWRRLGERMRQFLAMADWGRHELTLQQMRQRGTAVYLTICATAPELYGLPWELTAMEPTGQHLGELSGWFIGYSWPGVRVAGSAAPISGRLVMAWSAGRAAVPAERYKQALIKACSDAPGVDFEPARDVLAEASTASLDEALRSATHQGATPATMLALLCHGDANALGLPLRSSDAGSRQQTAAIQLRQLLAPHRSRLQLVVLGACYSGGPPPTSPGTESLSLSLHRLGIPWVVGARYPLSKHGAVCFARHFFASLAHIGDVDRAYASAREQLLAYALVGDWLSLQLYVHREARRWVAAGGQYHRIDSR